MNSRSKVKRHSNVRIEIKDGRFKILGLGAWYAYWRSPYYLMLTIPWQGFFLISVGLYGIANAVFAVVYLLGPEGSILNATPGSFLDAFFFSVQTSASIGYGAMSPGNLYADVVVALEAVISILGIAVLTGLAYTRFSRPTAKVLFSEKAVVSDFKERPTLMFRAANERRNQILEAQMRVHLTLDEYESGKLLRRFYELELQRDRNPSFILTWTALHCINSDSPLYGLSNQQLKTKNAALIVSVSGIDQTVAQAIHARHTYHAADIMWDYQLKDIFYEAENGDRYIDFSNFHAIESAQSADS